MARDITLWGATYTDVPAVFLPAATGGNAKFTDVSDTTAKASDVASGKYFYTSTGTKTAGTASGGSRVVIGTFTATAAEKGTVKTIALNYSGNGYPIALDIFPSEGGYNPDGDANNRVQRYGEFRYHAVKKNLTGDNAVPNYAGDSSEKNLASVIVRYKSSASDKTAYSNGANNGINFYGSSLDPIEDATACVRINSKTQMKVYIANTGRGFMHEIEYTYIVVYSS